MAPPQDLPHLRTGGHSGAATELVRTAQHSLGGDLYLHLLCGIPAGCSGCAAAATTHVHAQVPERKRQNDVHRPVPREEGEAGGAKVTNEAPASSPLTADRRHS